MSGRFIIDRNIFSSDIWQYPVKFRIFFTILGNAVWNKDGVMVGNVKVERGQYLRSYRKLQKDTEYIELNGVRKYGMGTIKKAIDSLVEEGRIEIDETKLGTLFTVVKYEQYQQFGNVKEGRSEQTRNKVGTDSEQTLNNKKKVKKAKKNKKEHIEIFNHWLLQNIIKHQKLTEQMSKAIDRALKDYSVEEIKNSISIYSEAYHSDYFYEYKHSLEDFMKQKNGLPHWLEGGTKYENYMAYKKKNNRGEIKATDGKISQEHKPKMIFRDL